MKNVVLFVLVCVVSVATGWLGHRFYNDDAGTVSSYQDSTSNSSTSDYRLPSGVSDEVQAESKNLDSFLLSIDSKENLVKTLKQIVSDDKAQNFKAGDWDVKNPTLRLYGMASRAFLMLEGAAYRLRNVVDEVMPAYLMSVSNLRGMRYYLSHYPKHLSVAFDYVVDPNPESEIFGHKGQFESVEQIRKYLLKHIVPELEALAKDGSALAEQYADQVIWVTNIEAIVGKARASEIFGKSSDRGGETHYKKALLGSHLNGAVAALYEALANGTYALSFGIDGIQDYVNRMMKTTYLAGRASQRKILGRSNIPSPREIRATLDKVRKKKTGFLRLTSSAIESNSLQTARDYYIKGVQFDQKHHLALFEQAESLSNPAAYIINPKFVAHEKHHIMEMLNTRLSLLQSNGPVDIVVPPTQEVIKVDVSKAFSIEAFADLGAFYPVCFYGDKSSDKCPLADSKGKHGQKFKGEEIDTRQYIGKKWLNKDFQWNYLYGRPEFWPNPTFNGLFPGATQKDVVANIVKFTSTPYLPALGGLLNHYK